MGLSTSNSSYRRFSSRTSSGRSRAALALVVLVALLPIFVAKAPTASATIAPSNPLAIGTGFWASSYGIGQCDPLVPPPPSSYTALNTTFGWPCGTGQLSKWLNGSYYVGVFKSELNYQGSVSAPSYLPKVNQKFYVHVAVENANAIGYANYSMRVAAPSGDATAMGGCTFGRGLPKASISAAPIGKRGASGMGGRPGIAWSGWGLERGL